MASVLLVFSGMSFSYALLDKGIARAKEQQADLTVLFLQEGPEKEGYGFPSDIDSAENLTNEADVRKDDRDILEGKVKIVRSRAKEAQITCNIHVSNVFSEDFILGIAGDAALILIDGGTAEDPADNELPFSPEKLAEQATCPVELVKNQ